MSNAKFVIGIVLSSVILSSMITSRQLGVAFVDSEPDEDVRSELLGPFILVVYLLFVIRYFVASEGRKYTVSAFSSSIIIATIAGGIYDHQVGGWFWNDDWVMKDALLASIQPIIILLVLNEWVGIPLRMRGRITISGQSHPTSLIRIGVIASLPLIVISPPFGLGLVILIPTLVIFFVSYWASTEAPLRLNRN